MLSELKKLLRHSSVYSIGNLLSKAIGFFLIPLYTRYLTPADYGVLELLELTSSIISLFLGLRIGTAVIRFFYDY
ncbi:MAG: lipopolysaccharide biosynthesis protein, partial [Candidatus Hodarchaeota archaeon]